MLSAVKTNITDEFKYRSKQGGPRSDCSYRSSLIWVHTDCHRGFLNISADEKSRRLKGLKDLIARKPDFIVLNQQRRRSACTSMQSTHPFSVISSSGLYACIAKLDMCKIIIFLLIYVA